MYFLKKEARESCKTKQEYGCSWNKSSEEKSHEKRFLFRKNTNEVDEINR